MRSSLILTAGLLASPAAAQAGTLNVTIPNAKVAEYHRPYLAAWVEPAAGGAPRTIALWYDVDKRGNEPGTKWLSDLRTWWRKGGRSMSVPVDGVTGQTHAPGSYRIPLPADLRPGSYVVYVEAVRENGGRELVSVPLTVPVKAASTTGHSELGSVSVSVR